MNIFEAGKGVNAIKLNENFEEVKNQANANESALTTIAQTALLRDGSNMSPDLINELNSIEQVVLSNVSGDIELDDNKSYDITLSGNATVVLPSISIDSFSHTIVVSVNQNGNVLNIGTTKMILQPSKSVSLNEYYSILYVYNKIENAWYAAIGG